MSTYKKYLATVREKFGMDHLILEGESEPQADPKSELLSERVRRHDYEANKGMKLARGCVEWKNSIIPIWYQIGK